MKNQNIYAKKLSPGCGVGIFTASYPANVAFREKYLHGVKVLADLGFQVIEGDVTKSCVTEGYRAAGPKERAEEFMGLIRNSNVKALISTIGGSNSSSLIPFLDFDEIRASQKVICGYSDVTSLHLAILHHAGLRTFYGPAVMPSFGEWPTVLPYTGESFMDAVTNDSKGTRLINPPKEWSNHFRDVTNGDWKNVDRKMETNKGWKVLTAGQAEARVIVSNLSTLSGNCGAKHFPDLSGKVLLLETATGSMPLEERYLRQLQLMGVFDVIKGLIIGKPEHFNLEGAPFGHDDLILETVGHRDYPIITGFDCSHTVPMMTLAEESLIRISAAAEYETKFEILEPMVVG
jgi:muramoyltetrapeptide carboxypeptidase